MTETIYIALYQGRSWTSRVIRWFTWSKWSHASLAWYADDKLVSIFEAWTSGGVRETHAFLDGHTPGTRIDLYEFRKSLTPAEVKCIVAAARAELGKPYDWRGILSFIFRKRMQKPGSWFCSELVMHCCLCAARLLLMCEPWRASPGDLAMSPELRLAYKLRA